ncbi:MAG: hypothetical protein RQ751_09350 [Longimicrobiales bacterium]|nr:hypothetical protein [Longimicrobiales bacterium]
MGRVFLVALAALAAAFYFDGSRAWLLNKGKPVIDPYFVMATRSEMEKIAQDLQIWERENFGRLPDERGFRDWLERNYAGGAGVDSWGSGYRYTLGRDSFYIRSPGPDAVRGTEDDIVEARPRSVARR